MISIHSLLSHSRANGPGVRAVVWLQGCTLACPGCFNPETHPLYGGIMANEAALAHRIVSENGTTIEGVTVSGGEPFLQEAALERFLAGLRHESSLSVLLFSGYRIEEIVRMKQGTAILSMTDILVDGPYDRNRHLGRGLLGSSNQRVHFLSSRYGPSDLEGLTDSEVQIDSKGVIVVTGIDRLRYRSPAAYRKERFRRAKFQVS